MFSRICFFVPGSKPYGKYLLQMPNSPGQRCDSTSRASSSHLRCSRTPPQEMQNEQHYAHHKQEVD